MKYLSIFLCLTTSLIFAQSPKIFISADMEGIGGIGTGKMVSSNGKDYATGRKLMTAEVNAVVEAIFAAGNATVVVNDSHGDMQNLIHTELDPRAEYIQSNIKPLGMVQGLDDSFDAVIFIGYHTRAGTENGFLAHTGSGSIKGLWINGTEVGEGGLNAYYAGSFGVPVILASGDQAFTEQFTELVPTRTVATKVAVGARAAKLRHPSVVLADLKKMTTEALKDLKNAKTLDTTNPVTFRIRSASTTRADVCMSIPGMKRIDGYTIEYEARNMDEAYRLIRVIYKYIKW